MFVSFKEEPQDELQEGDQAEKLDDRVEKLKNTIESSFTNVEKLLTEILDEQQREKTRRMNNEIYWSPN